MAWAGDLGAWEALVDDHRFEGVTKTRVPILTPPTSQLPLSKFLNMAKPHFLLCKVE